MSISINKSQNGQFTKPFIQYNLNVENKIVVQIAQNEYLIVFFINFLLKIIKHCLECTKLKRFIITLKVIYINFNHYIICHMNK